MKEAFNFDKKVVNPRDLLQIVKDNGWKNNPKKLIKDFPNLKKSVKYKGEIYILKFLTNNRFIIARVKNGKDIPLVLDKKSINIYRQVASWFFGLTNGNQILFLSGFEYPDKWNNLTSGGSFKENMKKSELRNIIREEILKEMEYGDDEYKSYVKKWGDQTEKLLKNLVLINTKVKNVKVDNHDGTFVSVTGTFELEDIEIEVGMMLTESGNQRTGLRPSVEVFINGVKPRKGSFAKTLTGKNATPEKSIQMLKDIFNLKYNKSGQRVK